MVKDIRSRMAWMVVAWAAVIAQVAPPACCGGCTTAAPPTAVPQSPAGGCRLCGVTADARETLAPDHSCRCQLEPRQEQLLGPSQGSLRTPTDQATTVVTGAASPDVPRVIGVGREYVAACLAVPIRPPRILFGVWRN